MKTYTINQLCYVNDENLTSHRDRAIAVNIVPFTPSKVIENFVLAIEDHQYCCEEWIAESNITNGVYFVTSIDVDVELPELENSGVENYFGVKIYVLEDEVEKQYYEYVSNDHNGYYSHTIYYSSGQSRIDVMESEQL